VTALEERIIPATTQEIVCQNTSLDAADVVREDFKPRRRIADRLVPQTIQVADLNQPYIRVHPTVLEQERKPDEIGGVLRCIVAADGTIKEGTRESAWVGDVEEVGNVQGRGGEAVKDADRPSLLGEAPVPRTDVALRVGVHLRVASVPEEPDVLLV